jgi:hypothetical protein
MNRQDKEQQDRQNKTKANKENIPLEVKTEEVKHNRRS